MKPTEMGGSLVVDVPQQPEIKVVAKKEARKRVESLDIFRGLVVATMIMSDDAGPTWPVLAHAPWNGIEVADFVMPFFLFIVGAAIPLAFKRVSTTPIAIKRIVTRTLKLILWGIFLQGGFFHAADDQSYGVDFTRIRWCGILQRIALAYLVVSLTEIAIKKARGNRQPLGHLSVFKLYMYHWIVGLAILIVHTSVIYGTYVPDWEFTVLDKTKPDYGKIYHVACGVRGKLDPPCNAAGFVDRQILGMGHLFQRPPWRRSKVCTASAPFGGPFLDNAPSWCHGPFEPEGIISSISAILSTVAGAHFGHVLIHIKDHYKRLIHWCLSGVTLVVLAIILHFTNAITINKPLYSFSYVCVTSGAAALVFSAFYVLVDILEIKYVFLPLKWIGVNAMLVYAMAATGIFPGFVNGWYYKDPTNTLVYWIQRHVFINVWHSTRVGILLYVIFGELLFWIVIAGILHWRKIYWKL